MKPPISPSTMWRASHGSRRAPSRIAPRSVIGRSPSSTAIANSASAPITHATIGMSGMAWREIRQNIGHDPTTSSASHASRRLTRRASIHHIRVSPQIALRTNGRRIPIIVRASCTISPE